MSLMPDTGPLEFREDDATAEGHVWVHRSGDSYVPVFGDFIGSDGRYEHVWSQLGQAHTNRSDAIRAGLHAQGSDDFNLAVVRKGHVVALLWMDEVIDDMSGVLHEIEQVIA